MFSIFFKINTSATNMLFRSISSNGPSWKMTKSSSLNMRKCIEAKITIFFPV